jgi:hypothetical protein
VGMWWFGDSSVWNACLRRSPHRMDSFLYRIARDLIAIA